jgi:phosphatidylglycerophosphate synthase
MYTRIHITRFPPTWAGKTSTVIQAVTLAVTIAVNAFLPQLRLFAALLFQLSLLMTLFSGWGYMRRASLMLRDDASPAQA